MSKTIKSCSVVNEDLHESFVIGDHHEFVAALGKIVRPVYAPDHSEGFSFNGCVVQEMVTGKCDSPSSRAAVWNARGATAVLLKEEVADTTLELVRADAGASLNVDDCHTRQIALTIAFYKCALYREL